MYAALSIKSALCAERARRRPQRFGVKLIVALAEPEALLGGFVGHAPEPDIERATRP